MIKTGRRSRISPEHISLDPVAPAIPIRPTSPARSTSGPRLCPGARDRSSPRPRSNCTSTQSGYPIITTAAPPATRPHPAMRSGHRPGGSVDGRQFSRSISPADQDRVDSHPTGASPSALLMLGAVGGRMVDVRVVDIAHRCTAARPGGRGQVPASSASAIQVSRPGQSSTSWCSTGQASPPAARSRASWPGSASNSSCERSVIRIG